MRSGRLLAVAVLIVVLMTIFIVERTAISRLKASSNIRPAVQRQLEVVSGEPSDDRWVAPVQAKALQEMQMLLLIMAKAIDLYTPDYKKTSLAHGFPDIADVLRLTNRDAESLAVQWHEHPIVRTSHRSLLKSLGHHQKLGDLGNDRTEQSMLSACIVGSSISANPLSCIRPYPPKRL